MFYSKIKYSLAILTFALTLPALNSSAQFTEIFNYVPSRHNIIISVDVSESINSELFKSIEKQVGFDQAHHAFDQIADFTGFDARTDLDKVYISGVIERDEEACVYLVGDFDINALISAVEFNEEYSESIHKGLPVHYWYDEKDGDRYGCFIEDDLLVIAGKERSIQKVIDAYDDVEFSFQKNLTNLKPGSIKQNASIWALASKNGFIPKDIRENPILNKLNYAHISIDLDPQVNAKITGHTKTKDEANAALSILNGLLALGKLSSDKPILKKLAEQASVIQNDKAIELSLNLEHQMVEPILVQKINEKNN